MSGFEGAISVASPYRYDDYFWTMDMRRPPDEGEAGYEEQEWELLGVVIKDDGEMVLWGHLKPRLLEQKRTLTSTYRKIDRMREEGRKPPETLVKEILADHPNLLMDPVCANLEWGHHAWNEDLGTGGICTCPLCRLKTALGIPVEKA